MEIERGQCFYCNSGKVLKHEKSEACAKLFINLFGEEKVGFNDMKEKLLLLKWCPICIQKLLLLLKFLDNLQNQKLPAEGQCIMCKNEHDTVKIKNWPHLGKILEEFHQENTCIMCLNCIYFVEMRNKFKEKLYLRYPQLKVQIKKRQSWTDSSPVQSKRVRAKRGSVPVIEISAEESPIKSPISKTSILKQLKPLKDNDFFVGREAVRSDPKFFAQIPYTKLQVYSETSRLKEKSHIRTGDHEGRNDVEPQKKSIFFKIKLKSHNNKYSIVKNKSPSTNSSKVKRISSFDSEKELKKHNINNFISINIVKCANFESETNNKQEDSLKEKSFTNYEEEIKSEDKSSSILENTKSFLFKESQHTDENCEVNKDKGDLNESQQSDIVAMPKKKKYKPKPLSKQKKNKLENEKQDEEAIDGTDTNKSKEKRRNKPGPLSKKKRRESMFESDYEKLKISEDDEKNEGTEKYVHKDVEDDVQKEMIENELDTKINENELEDSRGDEFTENKRDETVVDDEGINLSREEEKNEENDNATEKIFEEYVTKEITDDKEKNTTKVNHDDQESDEDKENTEDKGNDEDIENDENIKNRKVEGNADGENAENKEIPSDKNNEVEENLNDTFKECIDSNGDEDKFSEKLSDLGDSTEYQDREDQVKSNELSNGDAEKEKKDEEKELEDEMKSNSINKDEDENTDHGSNSDVCILSTKRKSDETLEGVFSPDKKKKRVTFSDEVLESSKSRTSE